MLGMRLGGIDPSILRELSGVYTPFVKAFKELVSNAFDADADKVVVQFADDFSSVSVHDDGNGMTPFDFRNDFTRIGGGSRRWGGEKTRKGRLRIGSKGIGFLALARYCDRLIVESSSRRIHRAKIHLEKTTQPLNVLNHLGIPIDPSILGHRMAIEVVRESGTCRPLGEGHHFSWAPKKCRISFTEDFGPVSVDIKVNCEALAFKACLDFERLLKLADNADLEKLDDFASIDVSEGKATSHQGTRITAEHLKNFLRRELRSDRRKGFVRNIASHSGFEQFAWHLSRCTPIPYIPPPGSQNGAFQESTSYGEADLLKTLEVHHGTQTKVLSRPLLPYLPDATMVPDDMIVQVEIDENGLKARGFLASYETVVFPAEFRGISIRVRGVSIGEPGFLGAEHLLTGANKAALSQITGEINVLSGLDAAETLNPGRESFYEESEHFKVLRKHFLGEGESVGGLIARAIAAVLRRSQVRSSLTDVLGRASIRRRAIEDVSAAVTQLIAQRDQGASAIQKMLKSTRSHLNGLSSAKDHDLDLPARIGGLAVIKAKALAQPAVIDYRAEQVHVDVSRDEWNWSLLLFDRRFEIVHKRGGPDQSIAEMDLKTNRIFVNWGHPVKLQMDERGFIRTALAWILAKEAACRDSDEMMNLALKLLSFTTSNDG